MQQTSWAATLQIRIFPPVPHAISPAAPTGASGLVLASTAIGPASTDALASLGTLPGTPLSTFSPRESSRPPHPAPTTQNVQRPTKKAPRAMPSVMKPPVLANMVRRTEWSPFVTFVGGPRRFSFSCANGMTTRPLFTLAVRRVLVIKQR